MKPIIIKKLLYIPKNKLYASVKEASEQNQIEAKVIYKDLNHTQTFWHWIYVDENDKVYPKDMAYDILHRNFEYEKVDVGYDYYYKRISNRGGKREGAGRKPTLPADAKPRPIRLTDEEYAKVKEFVAELRK